MRWPDVRPLDRVSSLKVKLGVLVGVSIAAASLLVWATTTFLGWRARYAVSAAVLIGLVVTQVLAHGMIAPLRRMTAAARELAAGRPAPPVPTTSRDEVGELARAFTAMAQDVASADERRRELLANVAHELRSPTAALRAQVENLVDGVRPADAAALTEVLEQVERLGGLVEDLLGLARAEAGAVPLQRQPTRLAPLVDDVVGEARTLRPDRHLVTRIDDQLIADVDPRRLRQILANLVDNATRHTPPGGQVVVTAQLEQGGVLVLDVADTGPGIPPEARAAVFERFRHGPITGPLPRVAAAGHPDRPGAAAAGTAASGAAAVGGEHGIPASGGTGLGLAIARWAATLHGGSIEVLPAARGARIRVILPPGRDVSA